MADKFIAYPEAFLFAEKGGSKKINHLLWGDWCLVREVQGDWVKIHCRGNDGWVRATSLQNDRILEVNFIDVGQGDGCHVVTPEDKHMVIDAGPGDNMYRFLKWRYGDFKKGFTFHSAVISHPDMDHYAGFKPLFEDQNVHFEHVFHNGLVERAGDDTLGAALKDAADGKTYQVDVVTDRAALKAITDDPTLVVHKTYPNMLKTAVDGGRTGDISWLCAGMWMPGHGPNAPLTIQVLGPMPEPDATGNPRLRRIEANDGKTKNGHSIILRLRLGGVSMLLGGDLNIPAENHLLSRYTGIAVGANTAAEEDQIVAKARQVFEVDIAKACHHGSADFTDLFLRAVNPVATIISSGDEEPHCHPRPDALGAIGKCSRGLRPLIFSTELARSSNVESYKPLQILREVERLKTKGGADAPAKIAALEAQLTGAIVKYGMINVRTDGKKAIIAQKLEVPRSGGKWDISRLEPDIAGRLTYRSKHEA